MSITRCSEIKTRQRMRKKEDLLVRARVRVCSCVHRTIIMNDNSVFRRRERPEGGNWVESGGVKRGGRKIKTSRAGNHWQQKFVDNCENFVCKVADLRRKKGKDTSGIRDISVMWHGTRWKTPCEWRIGREEMVNQESWVKSLWGLCDRHTCYKVNE